MITNFNFTDWNISNKFTSFVNDDNVIIIYQYHEFERPVFDPQAESKMKKAGRYKDHSEKQKTTETQFCYPVPDKMEKKNPVPECEK